MGPPIPKPSTSASLGTGKVTIAYGTSTQYADFATGMRSNQYLENIKEALDETFVFETDLRIETADCGIENAYYERQSKRITFCYEMLDRISAHARTTTSDNTAWNIKFYNITTTIMLHEIGHAFIDLFKLSITGREEDVADQFAASSMIDGADGDYALIDAAELFYAFSLQSDPRSLPFWDEHSMSAQRYYNMLCWIYGSNPGKHGWMLEQKLLPYERSQQCPREYDQMDIAWMDLLGPRVRDDVKRSKCKERRDERKELPKACSGY